jgi:adenine specific DNA methylase
MAAINELISRISDPELRAQIQAEVDKLSRQKKFGLVFEDHIPEATPLYGVPIRTGSLAARKNGSVGDLMLVTEIRDGIAVCLRQSDKETVSIPLEELVAVARFGEPIYPYLKPIDEVCNAPDSDLWHTLIEADNYHALQLLEYLYAGQVDLVYLDPPYNTGSDEWKYNDVFVDASDRWAHSKWLSFMYKRLRIIKGLLSAKGVIAISIGYQELHHLVMICEELFPAHQTAVVTVQTSGGKPSGGFNYQHEHIVFVTPSTFKPLPMSFTGGKNSSPFHGMNLASFDQTQRPNQTYPIYVKKETGEIVGCGQSLEERVRNGEYSGELGDFIFDFEEAPVGCVTIWPITAKGQPCVWRLIPESFMRDVKDGYIRVLPSKSKKSPNAFTVQFLSDGIKKKIQQGKVRVSGREPQNNTVIIEEYKSDGGNIPTLWTEKAFYTSKGTNQLQNIFVNKSFPYPKPLDLIADIIRACTTHDSIVIDLFAGSGTTLNAVNLINTEDDGRRECILVTNNELSKAEEKSLRKQGANPGDPEWERRGICRSITWPRTVYTIRGTRDDGSPLDGDYGLDEDDQPLLLSNGFAANAAYFKLGFLDKASVRIGRQFREMLPTLWMKAGCHGPCPTLADEAVPSMLVLPENRMAILNDSAAYADFAERVNGEPSIETVYLVTDSDTDYRGMAQGLLAPKKYQLYRDYLDNFRINSRRA